MQIVVTDDPARHRYEARLDDELAGFAAYRLEGKTVVFTHTEVQPSFEGRGMASSLVRNALEDVRARGLGVRPLCPFVRSYIDRHPAYADLRQA